MRIYNKETALVLATIIVLSFVFPSLAIAPVNDSDPIVLKVRDAGNVDSIALSGISQEKEKLVVVYSSNPVETRLLEISKKRCSLNPDTGEINKTLISSHTERYNLFQYHIIEGGDPAKHKSYAYLTPNRNSSYFLKSLEKEIDSLKNSDTASRQQQYTLSGFDGGSGADDQSWLFDRWLVIYVEAWDADGDGWVWKQRYQHEVHRSVYDYSKDKKWWTINVGVTTIVDSGDYKEDYNNWVGPWVHKRKNVIDDWDGAEWDNHPTTTVSEEWSYSASTGVQITSDGPTVNFGYSASWTADSVKTVSGWDKEIMPWTELFPPSSGAAYPSYGGYPLFMQPPIDASHHSFKSYRDALFRASPSSSFGFYWNLKTYLYRDQNFWWTPLYPLNWDRTTAMMVDSDTSPDYPAS
ncbi:MAG: hypothetical protein ACOC38_02595 [Promethearchaeia archaeon]